MLYKLFLTVLFILNQSISPQTNETAVVRAVLFYSPTCGHCQIVIRDTLQPLIEQYGEQFEIIGVDVTQPQGSALFGIALAKFNIESSGVPFLVIGDEYLSGSIEIPEKLPSLVEEHLAVGGVDWPDIPELREVINSVQQAEQAPPSTTTIATPATATPAPMAAEPAQPDAPLFTNVETETTVWQRVMFDPVGNGLAIIVLLAMIGILIHAIFSFNNASQTQPFKSAKVLIPVLCVIGLGVAAYLAYIEMTQTTAVCGPVGDCNTVQQSEYARLFGILPIGMLGVAGYMAILAAWVSGNNKNESLVRVSKLAIFLFSAFGFLFSIYLTFLEPFMIGATCAWCLSSAIIMAALFLITLPEARNVLIYSSKQI